MKPLTDIRCRQLLRLTKKARELLAEGRYDDAHWISEVIEVYLWQRYYQVVGRLMPDNVSH